MNELTTRELSTLIRGIDLLARKKGSKSRQENLLLLKAKLLTLKKLGKEAAAEVPKKRKGKK